ncbi:MAG TPA: IS110 family transposase [Burkholderiales bacterium]|nr:IS110 family transposase [Burkholderiales bacterium]
MDNKASVYGVDVAKAKLVIGDYDGAVLVTVDNTPTAIAQWLTTVAPGSIVAMEATGAYHQVLAALAHAAQMRVFVLNPRALKHYAEAIGQRGKTDPVDTRMIARYAMHEQARLIVWEPAAPATDQLAQLLQRRDCLVHANQMLAQSLAGVSALKASRQELKTSLKRMIKNVELLMRKELAQVPHLAQLHKRLSSIVGVGFVVAAQLVAALTRLRFARVESFIAYTGLDPRPDDSGIRRGRRRLSKRGPKLLRCLLYNAGMAAAHSKLFKPLYSSLRARGLQTTEAIVILARKLARIAFSLYRSGATFEPARHMQIA